MESSKWWSADSPVVEAAIIDGRVIVHSLAIHEPRRPCSFFRFSSILSNWVLLDYRCCCCCRCRFICFIFIALFSRRCTVSIVVDSIRFALSLSSFWGTKYVHVMLRNMLFAQVMAINTHTQTIFIVRWTLKQHWWNDLSSDFNYWYWVTSKLFAAGALKILVATLMTSKRGHLVLQRLVSLTERTAT